MFFYSSRRRHTRFKCDWSSDVCSSDLDPGELLELRLEPLDRVLQRFDAELVGRGLLVIGHRGTPPPFPRVRASGPSSQDQITPAAPDRRYPDERAADSRFLPLRAGLRAIGPVKRELAAALRHLRADPFQADPERIGGRAADARGRSGQT